MPTASTGAEDEGDFAEWCRQVQEDEERRKSADRAQETMQSRGGQDEERRKTDEAKAGKEAKGQKEGEDEEDKASKEAKEHEEGNGKHGGTEEEDEQDVDDEEEDGEEDGQAAPRCPRSPAAPANLRVLFSDVDGVLNSRPDPRLLLLEGGPCALLRRLLQASGALLVLTSPWRRHAGYALEALRNFGVFDGFEPPKELDKTPFFADASRRDLEILQWLGRRRGSVARFAVLDSGDLLRFASAPRLQGHVVRVTGGSGLRQGDVEAALRVLSAGDAVAAGSSNVVLSTAARSDSEAPSAARAAATWDDDLATKMEAVLAALSPGAAAAAEAVRPTAESAQAAPPTAHEFEATLAAVRSRFA